MSDSWENASPATAQPIAGRAPPHSPEAEQYLLSCCLLDGADTIAKCLEAKLPAAAFYSPANRLIYEKLCEIYHSRPPVELAVLAEELKASNQLDAVGGFAYLTQISSSIPTTAQAAYFLEKVREMHLLRELIKISTGTVEKCLNFQGGIDELLQHVEQASASIIGAATSTSIDVQKWPTVLANVQRQIDVLTDPNKEPAVDEVSFGFSDLDHWFQPMRGGQLVVLAARPSVGKSSLARMIAYAAVKNEQPTIFASLEVMAPSIAINLAQTITGIPYRSLRKAHSSDVAQFKQAVAGLDLPELNVMAACQVRLAMIRSKVKLMRARGKRVKLIVVDYLQLMPDAEPSKGETRATSVGRCSRALKQIAIEEDCVVLALSQLNRDSSRDGREPALHDLRESGDIEQDADKVILLHRPTENPLTGQPQPESSLPSEVPSFFINAIQAKGRDDGTAMASLYFRRAITRFEQIAKVHDNHCTQAGPTANQSSQIVPRGGGSFPPPGALRK